MISVHDQIAEEREFAVAIEELQERFPDHAHILGEDLINQINQINDLAELRDCPLDDGSPGHAYVFKSVDLPCYELHQVRDHSGRIMVTYKAISAGCIEWLGEQVGVADYKLWDRHGIRGIVLRRPDDAFAFRMRWC